MRKILFGVFGCLVAVCAHAAQVVNVDYVHKLIAQKWDISVPIKTNNIMAAVNMKYLLTAVDVANEILNGEKTTDYGNGEFATLQAADTVATIQAVDTLIQEPIEYKFFLTTTSTNSFSFSISAAGKFYIDWGDGKTQLITKNNVEYTNYSYTYKKTGTYTIKLGGIATGYTMEGDTYVEPAISFYSSASKIASIDGSLGAIFGTLADGTVPKFSSMFSGAVNLSSIPANLFSGINGTQEEMFNSTFSGCSGLTSIPAGLFAGISGAPASYMFESTFSGCSGLTSIPDGLFAGISGAPANGMFANTFYGCESLTYIPANLFAGVSGIISEGMFNGTFAGCTSLRTIPEELFASLDGGEYISGYAFMETFAGSGIESIPENLFGNITSSLPGGIFMQTFAYCPNLTGPSARIDGLYLYEIWPDATEEQVYGMYEGSTGLDDYACIPYAWGGGGVECDSSSSTPSAPEDAVYDFYLTTTSDTDVFAMKISAAGEFYIDWGDGKTEWVTKSDTTNMGFGHKYASKDAYNIRLGGQATAYNIDENIATISFYSRASNIASIDGSLGAIFGTLSSDTNNQPRFYQTFREAYNMTGSIPSDLFAGISGAPASQMFRETFFNCKSLTGPSARINEQYLYEIWPSASTSQVSNMYSGATGLDDYLYIPVAWGGLGATTNEYPSAPSDAVYDFYLTTTSDTDMFAMKISATGEFYIDWGDGKSEWITKSDTTNMTFGHKYASKGVYNIRLGGQSTAYNISSTTAAISFYSSASSIASIDGSLGAIFGTLADGSQPRFYRTFYGAHNMTGSIPSDLFAGISGKPASRMFASTFERCSGLTGAIPDRLFGNLTGAPASYMFYHTFFGCSKLTSIPENLFGNISGTAQGSMFYGTFYNCHSLTGPSARINGQYLYEIWPDATSGQVSGMYDNATGLSDYSTMPTVWK